MTARSTGQETASRGPARPTRNRRRSRGLCAIPAVSRVPHGGARTPMARAHPARHTRRVRRFVLMASLLLARPVLADLITAPPPPPDPERGNFWRDLVSPHQAEVAAILFKA